MQDLLDFVRDPAWSGFIAIAIIVGFVLRGIGLSNNRIFDYTMVYLAISITALGFLLFDATLFYTVQQDIEDSEDKLLTQENLEATFLRITSDEEFLKGMTAVAAFTSGFISAVTILPALKKDNSISTLLVKMCFYCLIACLILECGLMLLVHLDSFDYILNVPKFREDPEGVLALFSVIVFLAFVAVLSAFVVGAVLVILSLLFLEWCKSPTG